MMQGLITSIDGHPQSSGATRHDANGRRGHVLVQMQPRRAYSLEVGKSGRAKSGLGSNRYPKGGFVCASGRHAVSIDINR
jgi:hypothetical protein